MPSSAIAKRQKTRARFRPVKLSRGKQSLEPMRRRRSDVQAWLSELSDRGLAGASVRKAQGVLSGILGLAVRDRRLAVNPALGVALPADAGEAPPVPDRRAAGGARRRRRARPGRRPGARLLRAALVGAGGAAGAALRPAAPAGPRRGGVTEVDGSRLVWGTPEDPRPPLGAAARVPRRRTRPHGGDPPRGRAGLPLATGRGAAQRQRPVRLVRRRARAIGSPGSRRTNSGTPRPRWRSRRAPTSRRCSGCSGTPRRP
jgi:hypothetical protein